MEALLKINFRKALYVNMELFEFDMSYSVISDTPRHLTGKFYIMLVLLIKKY